MQWDFEVWHESKNISYCRRRFRSVWKDSSDSFTLSENEFAEDPFATHDVAFTFGFCSGVNKSLTFVEELRRAYPLIGGPVYDPRFGITGAGPAINRDSGTNTFTPG